jgi:NADPH:quinone reductase-like Zn-dependent oxidoreductase
VRAIRFKSFGDPSVLELAEVAAPAIAETMALVRVMAASVNPSDVKNVAGAMKRTTLPRIPGRDFAGVVEAGPPISQICGLGQAQEAYRKVAAGSTGRVVLRPQE